MKSLWLKDKSQQRGRAVPTQGYNQGGASRPTRTNGVA